MTTRKHPDHLRVIRSYRLAPETAATIEHLAAHDGLSQGQLIDAIVREYKEWIRGALSGEAGTVME